MIITGIEKDQELLIEKAKLLGSLLYFIKLFYKIRNGRDFMVSSPTGRESHHITICRALTRVFNLQEKRLIINVPPGHGKSTMLQYFIAWAWAHYPDCNFLYISYAHDEASKNTAEIKNIVSLPLYRRFFGIEIDSSSSAKDDFKTIQGGVIKAFGSSGAVTGKNAGFPGSDRFSGMLVIDDAHKPDEVYSDTVRKGVIANYRDTIAQRVRGPNVPRCFIGQCLHEDDLAAHFKNNGDGHKWSEIVIPCKDWNGNILDENVITKEDASLLEKTSRYVWAAQFQQCPLPAGGDIFKKSDFPLLDIEPNFICSFITADTAETDKTYNDPTVFSFWGMYRLNAVQGKIMDEFALHLIDCVEIRIEPKYLQSEFMSFYSECNLHKVRPNFVAIEKKSTGVTLISCLEDIRGLLVKNIERHCGSGSKIDRFMSIQPYIAKKLVSLPSNSKHSELFLNHVEKITANNSHRHDDIADTMYDAVKIALIDKSLQIQHSGKSHVSSAILNIIQKDARINQLRSKRWQRR